MNNDKTVVKNTTEHLTIAELLGGVPTYGHLPNGWVHPKAIDSIPDKTNVYVQNLRTKDWEYGMVVQYYERGRFLEVRCGIRLQKVFCIEHIAIKSNI